MPRLPQYDCATQHTEDEDMKRRHRRARRRTLSAGTSQALAALSSVEMCCGPQSTCVSAIRRSATNKTRRPRCGAERSDLVAVDEVEQQVEHVGRRVRDLDL